MSQLQRKSEVLCDAADLLHQEGHYCTVPHSAYYSCLQLSKHLWLHCLGKTDEELKCNGSHGALINATLDYIQSSTKSSKSIDYRTFNTKIGQLKDLREDADYGDVDITAHQSNASISLSNDILPILKKYI